MFEATYRSTQNGGKPTSTAREDPKCRQYKTRNRCILLCFKAAFLNEFYNCKHKSDAEIAAQQSCSITIPQAVPDFP